MKQYLTCFIDYKRGDQVIIKNQYFTKEDAQNDLERVAIEHVREYQGKQQADVCKQDKNADQLLADLTLKEGMYIRKMDDSIVLHEKINLVLPGRLWNSSELKVNKIGLFNITEFRSDDSMTARCSCTSQKREIVNKRPSSNSNSSKTHTYLQELQSLLSTGQLRLKDANRPRKTDKLTKKENNVGSSPISIASPVSSNESSASTSPDNSSNILLDQSDRDELNSIMENSIKSVKLATDEALKAIREASETKVSVIDNYIPAVNHTTDNINIHTVDQE